MSDNSTIEREAQTFMSEQTGAFLPSATATTLTSFEIGNPILLGAGKDISIVPHPSLLPKMGQVGYAIEDAIAELVDNSIDAKIDEVLEVSVNLGGAGLVGGVEYIEVVDHGAGMTEQQAHDALVLGKSNKSDQQIGKFGMGMKTACTYLGERFQIETATAEDEEATVIVYDEAEFIKRGEWVLQSYRRPKSIPHGTRIRIDQLKVKLKGHGRGATKGNKPTDRTRNTIARQHRIALTNGWVRIKVDGEYLQAHQPEFDPQFQLVRTEINELLSDGGPRVRGIVGVAKELKGKGEDYGFDLVRQGRVVKEHEKVGFNPHPMRRNIYGLIHLDEFPVNNNKMDFRRDTDVWEKFELRMKEIIAPIERATDKWYQGEDGMPAPGNKAVPDDIKTKYVLVRDGNTVKWVLPGYQVTKHIIEGKEVYNFLPEQPEMIASETADEQAEEDTDVADIKVSVEEGTGTSPATESTLQPTTEDNTDADGVPVPDVQATVTISGPAEGRNGSGSGFAPANGSGVATSTIQMPLEPQDLRLLPLGSSVMTTTVFTDQPHFQGRLNDVKFSHRTADDGPEGRHQTSLQSEDEEGTLEVVTNTGHTKFPQGAEARTSWYQRNVAQAVAEHLVATGLVPCEEQVSMEGMLLGELSVG